MSLDALDKIIHRVDTAPRSSEDANTDDILTALVKVFALKRKKKKLAVKLPPASTDHSRKHRMRKVESGTVKRVNRQAPRVMS